MSYAFNPSQEIYEETVLDPGTVITGVYPGATTYIHVGDFERFQFKLAVGSTNNNVAAKVVQATDAAGSGSKDITGAAITTLDGNDDNQQASIEVEVRKLDINNGFDYVALSLTITGTTTAYAEFRGFTPGLVPVTQHADFVEQVKVLG